MIEFKNITKVYEKKAIIEDISFEIEKGQLVVLIGSSGCGKTTLLKMINRLIRPTSGKILIDGVDIETINEIKLRRNIGYVIQQTGLFPHMTVKQNIEIIERLNRRDPKIIEERSKELMEMVGLDADIYLNRYPHQLSGGQQQRIGVARAFACDPDIILMDEPFSALDPITRNQLQDELAFLQANLKKTIVFVTHDMDEAVKIGDKICVMNDGMICQYDTVEEIMRNPADRFVEDFIGKNRIWSSPDLIKVNDVMINDPICSMPEISVLKSIEKMRKFKVDHLMIVDKRNNLLGVLSASKAHGCADKKLQAGDIMKTEFPYASENESISAIMKYFTADKASFVPVLDGTILKGLVTRSSLLTAIGRQYIEGEDLA